MGARCPTAGTTAGAAARLAVAVAAAKAEIADLLHQHHAQEE